ncbi:uncharacterized protein [Drosophila suzukii]|uniref:Uncharacterized protein n=1 Tax=Drosophila suzukii TaxID=28584 RepID=A0AB39ZU20_DROSZ
METLQLSIRLAHCAMKNRGRGESLSLFEAPATAIGNANPPSTFQLKSSKFTCNYQLGAAHVRGAPKSPDRKKGGRKLFAFQAPHEDWWPGILQIEVNTVYNADRIKLAMESNVPPVIPSRQYHTN